METATDSCVAGDPTTHVDEADMEEPTSRAAGFTELASSRTKRWAQNDVNAGEQVGESLESSSPDAESLGMPLSHQRDLTGEEIQQLDLGEGCVGDLGVPEEYQLFDRTQREQELGEYVEGPDQGWRDNVHTAKYEEKIEPNQDKAVADRLQAMQQIDDSKICAPVDNASLPLQVTVRNYLLQEVMAAREPSLGRALAHISGLGAR